jgi:hypothetical protein
MQPMMTSVDTFLHAAAAGDAERALAIVESEPGIAGESLQVAAVLGLDSEMRRLLADSDALGWAEHGRQAGIEPDGDYDRCIRALAAH